MGKLLTLSLVVATLGLAGARADDKAPPATQAEAAGSAAPAPAAQKGAPAKGSARKAAKGAKAKGAKGSEAHGSAPEAKPCEPVKPCPID